MDWKVLILIVAAGAAVLIAVLLRYEIVGVPGGGQGVQGIAYRLDRWTGEVQWMVGPSGGKFERK